MVVDLIALEMERRKQNRSSGGTGTLPQQLPRQFSANLAGPVNDSFVGRGPSGDIDAVLANKLTFRSDHGLIAAGVVAALGSVAFAVFMISEASIPEGLKEREISGFFARGFLGKPHLSAGLAEKSDYRPIIHSIIDYSVTGSISIQGDGVAGRTLASDSVKDKIPSLAAVRKRDIYVLRFVHRETALLQINHDLYVARRGTVLPRAGRVLSIERHGNRWKVVTSTQTFTQAKSDMP